MSASPARIDPAQRTAALALLGLLEGADGEALARAARGRDPSIGIIYATGDEGQVAEAGRLPGSQILTKPYDMRSLAACLAKFAAARSDVAAGSDVTT